MMAYKRKEMSESECNGKKGRTCSHGLVFRGETGSDCVDPMTDENGRGEAWTERHNAHLGASACLSSTLCALSCAASMGRIQTRQKVVT